MAKEVLKKHRRILLPELKAVSDMSVAIVGTFAETEHLVDPWKRISFDSVELEKRLDTFVPDVTLTIGDRRLLVEIRVTHAVDEAKRKWVAENNYPMVEYDFSKMRRTVDRAEIKSALIDTYKSKGMGRGKWIYHPKLEETKRRLTKTYLEKLDASRKLKLEEVRKTRNPPDPQQSFDF